MAEQPKTPKKIPPGAPACVNCVRWERFGKDCHYFWEAKKHCTMWADNWEDAAQQPQ